MIACLGPRRLPVGWRSCSFAFLAGSSLTSSIRTHKVLLSINAWRVALRGLSGQADGCRGISKSNVDERWPGAQHLNSAVTEGSPICVVIVGTDHCTLCSKAVLSVRRIIAALSQPFAFNGNHSRQSSVNQPLLGPSQVAQRLKCQIQKEGLQCSGAAAACEVDSTTATQQAGLPGTATARKGVTGFQSKQHQCCSGSLECTEHRVVEAGGGEQVFVKKLSLDCPVAREQLGLSEGDARRLRREVPIILVGGKPVCRLKFNGPSVRSALLKELGRRGELQRNSTANCDRLQLQQ
ncbi:hypothetical protein, conserved [Eimeria tenella]|uniref:Glutaredoxin domain-containing protein n=1 Tax=Eimeria tenella TaxID=5802 RepID=U6KNH1_EIMTE|nr:hypothetical protein, conserved [Eimeria tenella]CDJ36998.1 hypothetical protein, conserved [Eimeria tenella]|eukprot:XP_013227836.1 hypothetical protein, conserved [Eimeria tenella]